MFRAGETAEAVRPLLPQPDKQKVVDFSASQTFNKITL